MERTLSAVKLTAETLNKFELIKLIIYPILNLSALRITRLCLQSQSSHLLFEWFWFLNNRVYFQRQRLAILMQIGNFIHRKRLCVNCLLELSIADLFLLYLILKLSQLKLKGFFFTQRHRYRLFRFNYAFQSLGHWTFSHGKTLLKIFDDRCLFSDFYLVSNDLAKLNLTLKRFFLFVLLIQVSDCANTLKYRSISTKIWVKLLVCDKVPYSLVKLQRWRL